MTQPLPDNPGKGCRKRGTARAMKTYANHVELRAYLPMEMYAWLVEQARLRGCSMIQVVRDLIRLRMQESGPKDVVPVPRTIAQGVAAVTARIDIPYPDDMP